MMQQPISLCQQCQHVRVIVSGKGSQFLLCEKSLGSSQFAKYPPQPIVRCSGFVQRLPAQQSDASPSA